MTLHEDDNGFKYLDSLDDAKPEFVPVKVWSSLQFYRLREKTPPEILKAVKEYADELLKKTEPYNPPKGQGNRLMSDKMAMVVSREKYGLYESEYSTDLAKGNLEPIPDLQYTVFSKYEKRYYVKLFRGYDIESFYFRKTTDDATLNLIRYIDDGNVALLLTQEQFSDTTEMLKRVWKSELSGEGQLSYKIYIELLEQSIDLKEYKDFGKHLIGHMTVINQYETRIKDLWRVASTQKV